MTIFNDSHDKFEFQLKQIKCNPEEIKIIALNYQITDLDFFSIFNQ